jgi:uncharacterized membrane protein
VNINLLVGLTMAAVIVTSTMIAIVMNDARHKTEPRKIEPRASSMMCHRSIVRGVEYLDCYVDGANAQ